MEGYMIHCDKCKTVNPPDQSQCRNCHRNLLPGTGAAVRLFGLIFSLAVAALAVWVIYRMVNGLSMPDMGCFLTSPIFWGLVAIITPISGLVFALGKTPMHERYLERAKRHLTLDRDQALADLNQAVNLAPEKSRAPILKERAKLLEAMGQTTEATRDRIALLDANKHETAGMIAGGLGADKDIFVNDLRNQERDALLKTKTAVALGYCSACRAVVELNEKNRCPLHPKKKPADIRLAVPVDVESVRATMMTERAKAIRLSRIRWILVLVAAVILCAVVMYIGDL
jgi:RNA polymerase subunit RPABC4/transcription elongation factor Spt4